MDPHGVRIQVCGRVAIELNGRRLEGRLPSRQGLLLFVYLTVHRGHPRSRDELIEAIWPRGGPSAVDAALSALLSKLRKALGAETLVGRHEIELVLPDDAWIDLEAAEEAIHRAESAVGLGDWKRAWAPARIALHTANRGFLPGADAPWIEDQRRQLEDLQLRALECVAAAGLGMGGPEVAAAERSGRRLIDLAPYRESGYRYLMQALERQENVAEALRVYERLRCLLRDELGVTPAQGIQAIHQRLLGTRSR